MPWPRAPRSASGGSASSRGGRPESARRGVAVALALLGLGCALSAADVPRLKEAARESALAGRHTEALRALRTATSLAPEDPDAFFLLGAVALRAERPGEAETALARAVALAPHDARALSAHGLALRAQRRYEEAERALLRSLILRPADPSTLAALGEVYRLSEQPEKCAARYEQFVWQLEKEGDPEALTPVQQRAIETARDLVRACEAEAAAKRAEGR